MTESPIITKAYTSCRYGQLHYRSAGPRGGAHAPVVLLHQNPSSSYEYEGLIRALATDRQVIAFDTPGYGMSDAPPAPPGMAGYAAAFSDGLDALEREGRLSGMVDLYGYHTGTLLSCELAIARPDRVRAIALTGIPMFDAPTLAEKLGEARNFPEPDASGDVILSLLRRLWDYVVRDRDPRQTLDKAVWNFADKAHVLHRFTWAYAGVWAWDFTRLEHVTQPAVLIQTGEDLLEVSRKAAARIPSCKIVELLDLDRDVFDIAPQRIAAQLREFCDRL